MCTQVERARQLPEAELMSRSIVLRAAAIAISVAVAVAVVGACGEGPAASGTTGQGGSVEPTLTRDSNLAWSGSLALVVGGDLRRNELMIALYDPEDDSWAAVARPPFDGALFSPAVYWTGDSFLLVGIACSSFEIGDVSLECEPGGVVSALYSPTEDKWEDVADPELQVSDGELGRSAGSADHSVVHAGRFLAIFDHATHHWSVTAIPLDGATRECFAGSRLYELSSSVGAPRAMAYSVSDNTWDDSTITVDTAATVNGFACGARGPWVLPVADKGPWSAFTIDESGKITPRTPPELRSAVRSDHLGDLMVVQDSKGNLVMHDDASDTWSLPVKAGDEIHALALVDRHTVLAIVRVEHGQTTAVLSEVQVP